MATTDVPPQLNPPPTGEAKLVGEESLDAKVEPSKEKQGDWPFLEPQPIREDQVQNAVRFLSHPKVRGSPIVHRRSFLERKGLSRDEIDEAFRRVPDPPSNEFTKVSTVSPEGRYNVPQGLQQSQATVTPNLSIVPGQQQSLAQQSKGTVPLPIVQSQKRFRWSHVVFAIGFLTAAGTGAGALIKNYFIPKLKAWICRVVLDERHAEIGKLRVPNPVEEAAAAIKAAATALSEVSVANREMMNFRNEEWKHFTSLAKALESHMQELKSTLGGMNTILQNMIMSMQEPPGLHSQLDEQALADVGKVSTSSVWRTLSPIEQVETSEGIGVSKPSSTGVSSAACNGVYTDGYTVRPSSVSSSVVPDRAPYSSSYMEVLAMLERGEKPPGIQEVNDKPPNPDQPPSSSRLQPRLKPWETVQVQARSSLPKTMALNTNVGGFPVSDNGTNSVPVPAIESWNQGASSAASQGKYAPVTVSVLGTSSNAEPWWRRKKVEPELHTVTSWPPESTVRITEIDPVADGDSNLVRGSSQPDSAGSHLGGDGNRTAISAAVGRQGWVPPPAPPTVMPGAAAAIRYSKPAAKEESRSLPIIEEISSASLPAEQDIQKEAPNHQDHLSSASAPHSVPFYDVAEQARGSSEDIPSGKPSYVDAINEEAEVHEEL
eukprot:c27151_g2_i1 orf=420-2396(+)